MGVVAPQHDVAAGFADNEVQHPRSAGTHKLVVAVQPPDWRTDRGRFVGTRNRRFMGDLGTIPVTAGPHCLEVMKEEMPANRLDRPSAVTVRACHGQSQQVTPQLIGYHGTVVPLTGVVRKEHMVKRRHRCRADWVTRGTRMVRNRLETARVTQRLGGTDASERTGQARRSGSSAAPGCETTGKPPHFLDAVLGVGCTVQ